VWEQEVGEVPTTELEKIMQGSFSIRTGSEGGGGEEEMLFHE